VITFDGVLVSAPVVKGVTVLIINLHNCNLR